MDFQKFLNQKNAKTKQKKFFFEQNIHQDQNDYLKENNVLLSTKPSPNSPKDLEDDYAENSSFDASVIMAPNTQIQDLQTEINWLKNEIISIQQHNAKQKRSNHRIKKYQRNSKRWCKSEKEGFFCILQ